MDSQSTPPSICTTRKRLDAARRVLFVAAGYLGLPARCVPVAPMARFVDPAAEIGADDDFSVTARHGSTTEGRDPPTFCSPVPSTGPDTGFVPQW